MAKLNDKKIRWILRHYKKDFKGTSIARIHGIIKFLHRKHGPAEMVMPEFVRNSLHLEIGDEFEIQEIRNIKRQKNLLD